jgi:hypothetical protein
VVESVGAADLLATTLEAGVVIALLAPVRVTSARNAAFSGLVALVAVGGLTTAVAATSGAEEHAHSHDDATHTHDESTAAADGHVHDETTGATGDDTTSHSHAGHVTQDCTAPVTDEQRAAADRLVADTRAAVARYEDLSVAKAAGFIPITPEPARVVHYADAAALGDGVTLDPDHVESLVYAFGRDGHAYLLGAMYLLDDPNAVPPMPGGCLMQWHAHDNLCLAPGKGMVATVAADGSCPAGSRNQLTPMMLHVWSIDLSTGPFSELDQLRPAEVAAAIAARG